MGFHFDRTPSNAVAMDQRFGREPYLPLDYVCTIHYLTDVRPGGPAFAIIPGGHQHQTVDDARAELGDQVRMTPCRPGSWAIFSLLQLYPHEPACIFWANLTPVSLGSTASSRSMAPRGPASSTTSARAWATAAAPFSAPVSHAPLFLPSARGISQFLSRLKRRWWRHAQSLTRPVPALCESLRNNTGSAE
jgi:hypothetical protein